MSLLRAENIVKQFPGTLALDDVSCTFESGKVNALVGKNGSGKSTLVKIINGAQGATSGKIYLDDAQICFDNPRQAQDAGIATVYQELSLIPGLTVAENILMGRYPMNGKFIDWKKMYSEAGEILESMGIDINPKTQVSYLSMWQSQMIEIAKAMSSNPKVLFLDEPTSALAQHETQILFNLIRELKKKDVIIIYISHRLQELWEICDTCTVLRDGKYTGKLEMQDATHKELLDLMFGDTQVRSKPDTLMRSDEVIMQVNKLTHEPAYRNISFELKKGEVLGIAGMLGSGRTELLRGIFGADEYTSGEIFVENKKAQAKSTPEKMKQMGIGLTPEDRKHEGLIQIHSIKSNLCTASFEALSNGQFMDAKKEQEFAEAQVKKLQIKVASVDHLVSSLSGGNQQKVVVGNWLNTNPKIMMFDEPSRGIDVNAKQQIFEIIWELSSQGVSSVVVSSELEELLEVCQRILIMREGEIKGEVIADELQIDELYSLCMGGNEQ